MSAFVGVVNLDREPVDQVILKNLTNSLKELGSDRLSMCHTEAAVLGYALLRGPSQAQFENQPLTLDNKTWILGEVRLDGRYELCRKLATAGLRLSTDLPDVYLVLLSWSIWGRDLLNHLIGDFSFVVWNEESRLLFCARDQLGITPFFFSRKGKYFVFSNI